MLERFDIRALDAYAWVFDLVATDDDTREAALRRHLALLWRHDEHRPTGTLADPVHAFAAEHTELTGDELRRLEPYALLQLQWQERFPADRRRAFPGRPWMSWPLAGFRRHGVSPPVRADLEGLLLEAVGRPRRSHRWDQQWHLARILDSAALRDRLRDTAGLHARHTLWLLEHPGGAAMSARSWRRWRRTHGVPITHPRPAPDLAALPATEASAELAGLDPPGLAAVFEALEPAPAARIAAAMGDAGTVAAAIAAMDVRTAAWMFNSMPQSLAARLLAAMPPAVAAARFPRPKRDQVLLLMSAEDATARLDAMPPPRAGQQLQYQPADVAAGFLTAMDPAAAALALAAMSDDWAVIRILTALPGDVMAGLLTRVPARERDRLRWMVETERFEAAVRAAIT